MCINSKAPYLPEENYNYKFDFQVDPNNNYFLTTYTVSNVIKFLN